MFSARSDPAPVSPGPSSPTHPYHGLENEPKWTPLPSVRRSLRRSCVIIGLAVLGSIIVLNLIIVVHRAGAIDSDASVVNSAFIQWPRRGAGASPRSDADAAGTAGDGGDRVDGDDGGDGRAEAMFVRVPGAPLTDSRGWKAVRGAVSRARDAVKRAIAPPPPPPPSLRGGAKGPPLQVGGVAISPPRTDKSSSALADDGRLYYDPHSLVSVSNTTTMTQVTIRKPWRPPAVPSLDEWERFAGGKEQPYPYPQQWIDTYGVDQLVKWDREALKQREEVVEATRFTWQMYSEKGLGSDRVLPLSGRPVRDLNSAVFLVDSLSTLYMMNLTKEFEQAASFAENELSFDYARQYFFFEIVIRVLGGLLSAHALSGRPGLLLKATDLGDRLMAAINKGSYLPNDDVNIAQRTTRFTNNIIMASAGTFQLEFRCLSFLTGDPKYQRAADGAFNSLRQAAGGDHLLPFTHLAAQPAPRRAGGHPTVGGMADSYYEYLLKQWIQTGKTEPRFFDLWQRAMDGMMTFLVGTSHGPSQLMFIADTPANVKHDPRMEQLVCFMGGLLKLGVEEGRPHDQQLLAAAAANDTKLAAARKRRWVEWDRASHKITQTCYEGYARTATGLSPEFVGVRNSPQQEDPEVFFGYKDTYKLRPETVESIYLLWYYTGDPTYRQWGYKIWRAIQKHCKAKYGYAFVEQVNSADGSHQSDETESFWTAEVLKYFYLLFSPRWTFDLSEWVFNTEAHPLPIFRFPHVTDARE